MLLDTFADSDTALSDILLALSVFLEISRMVELISSDADAIMLIFVEACSTAAATDVMLELTCSLALDA